MFNFGSKITWLPVLPTEQVSLNNNLTLLLFSTLVSIGTTDSTPHLQRKRESRTPVDYHTWESYLCQAVYLQTSLSSCLTHFSLTGELNHWHMGNILGLFSHTSESMFTRPSKTLKPHQPDIIQYVTLSCKFSLVSLRPTSPGSHIRLKAERKKEE